IASYTRAITVLEHAYGPDYREAAIGHGKLGLSYLHVGRLDDAQRELSRAVEICERTLGPDHLDLGPPLTALGELALRRRDLPTARRFMTRAHDVAQAAVGADHPYVANIDIVLAAEALAEN